MSLILLHIISMEMLVFISLAMCSLLQSIDEIDVAIKTCKPDASNEDRVKFLEEACEFVFQSSNSCSLLPLQG